MEIGNKEVSRTEQAACTECSCGLCLSLDSVCNPIQTFLGVGSLEYNGTSELGKHRFGSLRVAI